MQQIELKVDAQGVIEHSKTHNSDFPVTTARYLIEVVTNEENCNATNDELVQQFSKEFQRALDDGYFSEFRYDLMLFEVLSREVLAVAE